MGSTFEKPALQFSLYTYIVMHTSKRNFNLFTLGYNIINEIKNSMGKKKKAALKL